MPLEELRAAVRRVIGGDVPMSRTGRRRALGIAQVNRDQLTASRPLPAWAGVPGRRLGTRAQRRRRPRPEPRPARRAQPRLEAGGSGQWLGTTEGLLGTYQSERHPVGQRVIMHTRAQTALLSPGANITALRELFKELLREQSTLRHIADLMAGADVRYDAPPPGRRTQWPGDGCPTSPCTPPPAPPGSLNCSMLPGPSSSPSPAAPTWPGGQGLGRPGRRDHRHHRGTPGGGRTDPPGRLRRLGSRPRHAAPADGLRDALRTWFGARAA